MTLDQNGRGERPLTKGLGFTNPNKSNPIWSILV